MVRIEPLLTLREIAAKMGRPHRAVRRMLDRLYAEDLTSEYPPQWRVWSGRAGRATPRYNVTRLQRAHPELFGHVPIDRAEFGSLEERATALELELRRVRHRIALLERASKRP
jgi:predicted ArsR family transcriptional regulator